jgi:hypothetical protein
MLAVRLKMIDKNWIKPPNTIVRKGPDNVPHKLSYWIDKKRKFQLYTKEQLATLNILTNLNLTLIRALILMDTLKKMDVNAKIKTLVSQDYQKFEAKESSIFNHFVSLMAAVPNVTFGEFLGFLSGNTDPQDLIKIGQKTLKEATDGKSKTVSVFYTSDKLKER